LGRFGLFLYSTKVDAKLAELVPLSHKFAKRKSRRNFSKRTRPIHSIGPKTHVLGRFGPFRYSTKVNAKLGELVPVNAKLGELVPLTHKFAKQSRVGIFHNQHKQCTQMDPKLMFLGVSDRFDTPRNSMQNWPNRCH
jgi:hypothetical protein